MADCASEKGLQKKAKVFLALDIDDKNKAFSLVERWSPLVEGFKVGPRLGFQLTQREWTFLSKQGSLFLDYKFFDIPSTVESSVDRAFQIGADFCTVHAFNGKVCLKRLSKLEKKLNQRRPFKILVVTLLTSFDQDSNPLPLLDSKSDRTVCKLTDLAIESGLSSLVCSPAEARALKSRYPKLTLVCPGVRFKGDSLGDQKRVLTPKEAFQAGADHLVMGRSLIHVSEPERVFEELF